MQRDTRPDRVDRRLGLGRTAALVLGTLALSTAFIAAYVGALHQPGPRDLPVGVVRGDQLAWSLLTAVRHQTDDLRAVGYADRAAAADALDSRRVYAVLTSPPAGAGSGPGTGTGESSGAGTGGPELTLTTASAASPLAVETVVDTLTAAATSAGLPLTLEDTFPVSPTDPRGLAPFYLAVGLVLGGYLSSTVLGLAAGTTPAGPHRAASRIATLTVFAVLLGLAGSLVTGPGLDIWTGNLIGRTAAGTLIVLAAGMIAAAVQGWLGLLGTGLVILLLVVLENPGAGGSYPAEFLPAGFRNMYRWNLPGLATELIKSVVYFPPRAADWPVLALTAWALVGLAALLAASVIRGDPDLGRGSLRSGGQ